MARLQVFNFFEFSVSTLVNKQKQRDACKITDRQHFDEILSLFGLLWLVRMLDGGRSHKS